MSENNMAVFLTHLFDGWNAAGVKYLILRNYEELPKHTDNDVDILVSPPQLKRATVVLQQAAENKGWRIHNVGEFACFTIHLFHEASLEQVHIDLMCGIKWHALPFIDDQNLLNNRCSFKNFYIPTPAHEAAVNLMTRLIYRGYVKEPYRAGIKEAAQTNGDLLSEALSPWIGPELAGQFIEWAAADRWNEIEDSSGMVRKNVLKANCRKPFRFVGLILGDVFRIIHRWAKSPGCSIVFFGPDGCGKSSVADELKVALGKSFASEKGLHCHWKPVRPKGTSAGPIEDPHGKPPRNLWFSLMYFMHHYLPFMWGWWLCVKPVLFKNGLVIIDRYYYDFFVDPRRYRLTLPQWVAKLGYVFVKNPDLVFCLDAEPEILQARKNEVSFEECKRQREAYRALAETLPNGHVIDASQPLEQVAFDVQTIVLEYMAARAETRMGKS